MQIEYRNVEVELADRSLHVRTQLRNRTDEDWAETHALSWQIYDADADSLLEEGPHEPMLLPAAQATEAELEIPLPAEDGRYQIFVSALTENVAWLYEDGSPFVLIDAEVRDGEPHLIRRGVSTLRDLGRRRFGRALRRALAYPLASIWRNRSLIRSMVRRDVAGRYAGSYGGVFWTIIHPLMMMLTYWFVFGFVLRARFEGDSPFVLYFLAGMLPWLAFSEAAGRAPTVVLEHSNFVKKLVFPLEILPVNLTAAGLFSQAFGFVIFLAGMLILGKQPTATAMWVPLLIIPQALFTLGVSWFLAAMGVFFRDLGQFIGFVLMVWFFTTPICYGETYLPGRPTLDVHLQPDLCVGPRLPRRAVGGLRPRGCPAADPHCRLGRALPLRLRLVL